MPAVGEESVGTPMYDATVELAALLGSRPLVVPGDHGGFGGHPEAFAQRLREAFAGS